MKRVISKPIWLVAIIVTLTVLCAGFLATTIVTATEQQRYAQESESTSATQLKNTIAAIEAKKNQPVYITLSGADQITALREDYSQPSSLWMMVNKQHSAGEDYIPTNLVRPTVPIRPNATADEQKVRSELVTPLADLFAAAKTQGYDLMIGSAYRSAQTQTSLFNSYVAASGLAKAQQYSARPGHSEHQLGLAVDISTASQACYLDECFLGTPEGAWLAQNAYKYGFTLRYKKGKEAITGYNFEPWHYRYVGVDLATALYQSDLTVEEAWPQLEAAQATLKANKAI